MASPPLTADEIDRLARKRAGAKLGWYVHALVYLVVNAAMFAASFYGLRQRPWTIYPALGWGLGLTLHGIAVFVLGSGSALRERMFQKERERLQREQQGR
jgi:2TM domain